MWCIAWWHSGREDEDEDEEIAGPESSRTVAGYEETLTPLSAETPLPSTECPSLNVIQTTGIVLDKVVAQHDYKRPIRPIDLTKTISNDSVRNAPSLCKNYFEFQVRGKFSYFTSYHRLSDTDYYSFFSPLKLLLKFPLILYQASRVYLPHF